MKRLALTAALLALAACLSIASADDQKKQLTRSCACSDDDSGMPLSIETKEGESEDDLRDRFALKCDSVCNRQVRVEISPECRQRISNYARLTAETYTAAELVSNHDGLATRTEQCEHSTRQLQVWETSARKSIEAGRELATCYEGDKVKRALESIALAEQKLEASLTENKAKIAANCK